MQNQPEPNLDLFIECLARIKQAPRRWSLKAIKAWRQSVWASAVGNTKPTNSSCGTAFCMAGHACDVMGYQFNWTQGVDILGERKPQWQAETVCKTPRSKKVVGISEAAKEALGINEDQAGTLFDGDNTRKQLFRKSAKILNLDPKVLEEKVDAFIADGRLQDVKTEESTK